METVVIILGTLTSIVGIVFLLNALINTSQHYFHQAMYLRSHRQLNEKMMKEIIESCP